MNLNLKKKHSDKVSTEEMIEALKDRGYQIRVKYYAYSPDQNQFFHQRELLNGEENTIERVYNAIMESKDRFGS